MYEYLNLIPNPKLPPLIITKGKFGPYYVYTYKNVWDSEKKRSRRTNVKLVGKVIGGQKEGEIKFTEEFIKKIPNLEFFKVSRKDRKYIFTPIEQNEIVQKEPTKPKKVYHAGATWALDNIVANTPLTKALARVFNTHADYKKILSLAYFIILNQNNNVSRYEEFAEVTRLPYQRPMCSSVISRLFKRITPDKIDRFISIMNDMYFENKLLQNEHLYLALDSTSISTQSECLSKAEYGHNKDLDPTKQINILMLVDQSNGMPIFYRAYDGSVPDVATVRNTISQSTRLNIKNNITLVADKGYQSADNINDCLLNGFSFIFNCRVNVKNSFIQETIDEVLSEIISCKYYNHNLRQCVIKREIEWKYDDYPIFGKRKNYHGSKKLNLHIYYNKEIADNNYETLIHNASVVKELVEKNQGSLKGIKNIQKQIFEKYLDYNYDKKTDTYSDISISPLKIHERVKYAGIRVLITDREDLTGIDCHKAYFERNKIEYAYHTLKYRLGCNRLRCSDNKAMEGKVFVQFIASAISTMVRHRLDTHKKDVKDKKESAKIIYESDGKILDSLNNIFMCSYDEGFVYDEIVGKKANFFKALSVPIPTSGKYEQNDSIEDGESDYLDNDDIYADMDILEEGLPYL